MTTITVNWRETDLYRDHEDRGRRVLLEMLPTLVPTYELAKCESPLEAIFCFWWYFAAKPMAALYGRLEDEAYYLQQQDVDAGGRTYRLDFAFYRSPGQTLTPLLAVELDGHEFHERTPSQVAIRDTRDRDLQSAGWEVLHFSYAEFTSNPLGCIQTVRQRLYDKVKGGGRHGVVADR